MANENGRSRVRSQSTAGPLHPPGPSKSRSASLAPTSSRAAVDFDGTPYSYSGQWRILDRSPHPVPASLPASSQWSDSARQGRSSLFQSPPSRQPRDTSVGTIGSGRMRTGSIWSSELSLEEEDDEKTRSGATSRRHSVATFTPRDIPTKSQTGFHLPGTDEGRGTRHNSLVGFTLEPFGNAFSLASSKWSDADLETDLNALHLSLDAHVAANPSSSAEHSQSPRAYVSSLPKSSSIPIRNAPTSPFTTSRDLSSSYDKRSPSPATSAPRTSRPLSGSVEAFNPAARYFTPENGSAYSIPLPLPAPRVGDSSWPQSSTFQPGAAGFPTFPPPASPANIPIPRTMQYGPPPAGYYAPPIAPQPTLNELGKGIPLHAIPHSAPLYVVEFKAGRNDLFYVDEPETLLLKVNDLVIVEADRGKDLGKIVATATLDEVREFQMHQVENVLGHLAKGAVGMGGPGGGSAAAIARMAKEIHPKRIYGRASPTDVQLLAAKEQDEEKALGVCRSKIVQHGLPMEVTEAEFQFDRRRLTFFYRADRRIDFRVLVKDLFRLYKTRIWLCAVESTGPNAALSRPNPLAAAFQTQNFSLSSLANNPFPHLGNDF